MTWDGTTLTSPNGGSIVVNEKAKKALEQAFKDSPTPRVPQPGDRHPTPLDGGRDPAPASTTMPAQMIWYGDPAEHPNAYIAITDEGNGTILVRDGMSDGGALSFSREQWAALTSPDEEGLGKPQGSKDAPAMVRNPDELYKVDRGDVDGSPTR